MIGKLKRFMTDEELEEFNRLREVDNILAAQYMSSLDLFEPTNLDIVEEVKQKEYESRSEECSDRANN